MKHDIVNGELWIVIWTVSKIIFKKVAKYIGYRHMGVHEARTRKVSPARTISTKNTFMIHFFGED